FGSAEHLRFRQSGGVQEVGFSGSRGAQSHGIEEMNLSQAPSTKIFLTGVTGFVGKVVLEEILRRREALGFERIFVLIRTKQGHCPEERFKTEVAASPCLSKIPGDWTRSITVIPGELSQERCGFSNSDWQRLTRETTHIINCAASVEFDLPLELATASN